VAARCNICDPLLLHFPNAMRPQHSIAAGRVFQNKPACHHPNRGRSACGLQIRESQGVAVAREEQSSRTRIHG
jgi:hypothetical protein